MKVFTRRNFLTALTILCATVLLVFTTRGGVFALQQTAQTATQASPVGLHGYDIDVFARGTSSYFNPDSVDFAGQYVFVGYQNMTATDGSDGKSSTVVQYTLQGKVAYKYQVLGHCDGLRFDPYTNMLWATSNEDANARLAVINIHTHAITTYLFPSPAPHGGGYDDIVFTNGMAFVAASNPTLNSQGVNVNPSVDEIALSNGKIVLTPVLFGNSMALDTTTNKTVQLNMTDPDSMIVDPQGDVVVDSQADAEIIFIHNPGTASQAVSRVPLGTQVDDTVWATTSRGHLLVADSKANTIYRIWISPDGFVPGTVYTEAPSDSGVAGFVGTIALSTGTITPVMIGFSSPTGMIFIPNN